MPPVRRIRILFPFVGGDTVGGSHISATKLIQGLDPERYETSIVLHREAADLGDFIRDSGLEFDVLTGVPILAPRHSRKPGDASLMSYAAKTLGALRRYLVAQGADIVHTNDGRVHVNWALPTKLAGRKLLWHHREDPRSFGANRIAPFVADRMLSVSEFALPSNPIRSMAGRTEVVRSPFDLSEPCPDKAQARAVLAREINVPDSAVLLGYFGGLVDRKRPLHFVRAIHAIQNALSDRPVHGLFFGTVIRPETRLDEHVISLASELGIDGQIHLMGFRQPVAPYMAAVDATLVTALNEPFGRTLIEAMHLRTPVIATRHGGNVEAIEDGETGFLVDPDDAAAFAPPVVRLLREPALYAAMTRRAEEHVHHTFSVERHVAEVSAVYDALLPR